MKLFQRIKTVREEKKISQSYIAHEVGLDQSQYSRREKGEIQFMPEEIIKIAHLLDTSVSHLFGEQANPRTQALQTAENLIIISEKLIEQYEFRLKEKDELIALLRKKQTY